MNTARKLAALAAAALLLAGCNREQEAAKSEHQPEIRPVRTMVVEPQPFVNDFSAVGEISPRYESDLGFRVSGKLVARSVDIGSTVKQGDVLARLDDTDFNNNLRSAKAQVDSAQAVLTEAKAAEQRQAQLLANGTTTRSNYDAATKNLTAAQAQLDAARASYQIASDQLEYTGLKAEFDGVVTAIGAEPGQVISTGQMVVRLARPDDKDAVFSISEAAFKEQPDSAARITVSLLAYTDISAEGELREVSPVADPATRTYKVKVTLRNPPPQMRFGASVVGHLTTQSAPVMILPGSALFDQDGKAAVWRFDSATGTVSLLPVTVKRYETDKVIVEDGLESGTVVVTAGVNRLREGQKVRLEETAK